MQVLADGFGCELYPKTTLPKSLGKLSGVPGALFLGEFPFHEGPRLLGYGRRVARRRCLGKARRKAALLPAAEVAPDALRAAAGV